MDENKAKIPGYLDGIDGLYVYGWVWDPENPEKRLEVVVYVDEEPVAEGVADLYREDLEKAGIGDGKYGFRIRLPNNVISEDSMISCKIKDRDLTLPSKVISKIKQTTREETESEKLMLKEFDHEWFKKTYNIPGISDKLTLFKIYKELVKTHRVSPNPNFNEKLYLFRYKDVEKVVKEEKFLCGFEHYLLYGKKEGRKGGVVDLDELEFKNDLDLINAFFDEEWYVNHYPEAKEEMQKENITAFQHYIKYVRKRKYSPNHWFDEKWYVSFYEDVKIALESGLYLSGFEEYLKIGKKGGRIPSRKSFDIINAKFPGAANPVGIDRINIIEKKITKPNILLISSKEPKINFVLPTFDRDIMFGGYISLVELIKKIQKWPFDIRFLICEDRLLSEDYFWYNYEEIFGKTEDDKEKISFQNIIIDKEIEIGERDIFIAYSSMTALLAYKLASDINKVIYLIQEDERIFHSNNSIKALIDYVYSLPIIFLFNSKELYDYFKKYEIGPFKKGNMGRVYWFDCPITEVERPTLNDLLDRKNKKLLFYARPEAHAERNLFEMGVIALKKAIKKGYFSENFVFHGIGSAKDYKVELVDGYFLDIKTKMDLETYKKTLKNYDIGLFLMYAPHPGLVGFEMASAGMIVVVNSYDYRDKDYYESKSKNFVVAEPHPNALADALKEAVIKASNPVERLENIYIPTVKNWDEALPDEMIKEIFESAGLKI